MAIVVAPARENAETMSTRCPAHVKRTAVTGEKGTPVSVRAVEHHLPLRRRRRSLPEVHQPASLLQAAREVAGIQVLSHFGGEYDLLPDGSVRGLDRQPDDTLAPQDYYLDFAIGMQEIGYHGFTGYELCHPLPKVNGGPAAIDFADKNARLAVEYMRAVVRQAERTSVAGV